MSRQARAVKLSQRLNTRLRASAAAASSGIVTSGLVIHLDAGDAASYPGSGTAWTDLSGNGNNGTLTNGPTYSAADGGQIVFDGVNDEVIISGSRTVTEATFEIWLKRTGTVNSAGFFYNRDGSNTAGIAAYSNGTSLGYNWADDAGAWGWNSGLTVPLNGWAQCVASISGSSATLYVNQSSATNTLTHGSQTLSQFRLARDTIAPRFLVGSIAIARFYNRALSVSEVTQNFNANRGRYGL
jgi:hypothetical protein